MISTSSTLIQPNVLDKLNAQDWKAIFPALVAYTHRRINRLVWRTSRDELPGGFQPKDLAKKAIEAVFEGKRNWDPETQPDIFRYLQGVINSYVYHLVHSPDHLRRVYQPQPSDEEGPTDLQTTDLEGENATPLDDLMAKDLLDYLWREAKGDSVIEAILVCVENGIEKRSEIAKEFALTVDEITNAKKRLKRLIEIYQRE